MFQLTPSVRLILLINVFVFALPQLMGTSEYFTEILGLHHVDSPKFQVWQWFTHMFVHSGFNHILFNMLGLVVFGPMLESVWGSNRFMIFYLICGLGAGMLYSVWNYVELMPEVSAYKALLENTTPGIAEQFVLKYHRGASSQLYSFFTEFQLNPKNGDLIAMAKSYCRQLMEMELNRPMVGASGAIYGVLAAFGLLFPNTELMLIFPPIPIKAKFVIGVYAIIALWGAFNPSPGDSIAHFAHVGGMVFGALLVWVWKKDRRNFY